MDTSYHTPQPRRKRQVPQAKPGYKVCNACEQEKHLDEYHRDPYASDERCTICKDCKNARRHHSATPKRVTRSEDVRAKRRVAYAEKREARLLEKQRNPPPPEPVKDSKVCPRCDPPTAKPLSDFPVCKTRKDGHGGWCKECVRKWTNSEEEKARQRAIKKEMRRDPEQGPALCEKLNNWRRRNPQSQRELTLRRNARKKQAQTEPVDFTHILGRDGEWCYICENTILPGQDIDFDHVLPLARGGAHADYNIRVTHRICNRRKADKLLEELTPFDRQGPNS